MTQIASGLAGIVVPETRLSRVDGAAGELIIGGFPLENFASRACFEETVYLLWNRDLPGRQQLEQLRSELSEAREISPLALDTLRVAARQRADPMAALRAGASSVVLESISESAGDTQAERLEAARHASLRLTAAFPTLAAAYHRTGLVGHVDDKCLAR